MEEKKIKYRFGEFVRKIRTIRCLTVTDLALKCGMTKGYLSEIETGKRNAGGDKVERILKELGCRFVIFLDKDWEWDGSLE